MKIDFSQKLTNLLGDPLVDDKGKELDLSAIAVNSLLIQDSKIDGPEKLIRFDLAKRIFEATEAVTLTAEEIAKIKELVNVTYTNILVVGRAWTMLENPTEA